MVFYNNDSPGVCVVSRWPSDMHCLKCICRFDVVVGIVWQCPALNAALQAGCSGIDYVSSLFSPFITCIVISGRAVITSLVITSIGGSVCWWRETRHYYYNNPVDCEILPTHYFLHLLHWPYLISAVVFHDYFVSFTHNHCKSTWFRHFSHINQLGFHLSVTTRGSNKMEHLFIWPAIHLMPQYNMQCI